MVPKFFPEANNELLDFYIEELPLFEGGEKIRKFNNIWENKGDQMDDLSNEFHQLEELVGLYLSMKDILIEYGTIEQKEKFGTKYIVFEYQTGKDLGQFDF